MYVHMYQQFLLRKIALNNKNTYHNYKKMYVCKKFHKFKIIKLICNNNLCIKNFS